MYHIVSTKKSIDQHTLLDAETVLRRALYPRWAATGICRTPGTVWTANDVARPIPAGGEHVSHTLPAGYTSGPSARVTSYPFDNLGLTDPDYPCAVSRVKLPRHYVKTQLCNYQVPNQYRMRIMHNNIKETKLYIKIDSL